MSLQDLGWNASFETAFASQEEQGLEPARVAREDRNRFLLLGEHGELTGELAGRLRHRAEDGALLPRVGDWVAVRRAGSSIASIVAVLPRTSAFVRKQPGEATEGQVVAANIDTLLLVSGMDGDFNPRRIERYLAAAWESGAEPVVVLNKADLAEDVEARVEAVEAVALGVPVIAVSALERRSLEALEPWLAPGRTVALVGSSGTGKSTLINALLGEDRMATGAVREDDSRGRHTTTHRELVPLPGGALLIDTPGMRELQLWGDASNLEDTFPDVAAWSQRCRFRDCSHAREPGCAVRAAVESGALPPERFESWRKLERELRWLATRNDVRARAQQQARWKSITKSMKRHPKADRWR